MFLRRKIAVAVRCALGLGGALALAGAPQLAAAQQPAQPATKVEKIEVTGSQIKRVDTEGPSPLLVIDQAEIQRTGATTVNELLRSIPQFDIFDQGELTSNSPSGSGTANVRLRGLSENNTLVLLNGRRLPVNALYDASGAGAAVDVNMIPLAAIERVEVLLDGASAIYGADAVAGVVNFITRKDYAGVEGRLRYGVSSEGDGDEWQVGGTVGFGNLEKDGFNVMIAADYFKRDPIYRKDREISKSSDYRRLGGLDGRSSFAPQGNILDPETFGFTGNSVQPCPPELFSGNRCRYDFNSSLLTAYNGADRWSALATGTFRITRDMRAFATLMYAHAEDHFEAHPVPDYFIISTGDIITGRFMQGGPRITDRESEMYDISGGLEGTIGGVDWRVVIGQGQSKVKNRDSNYYNAELWYPATEGGLLDPTVDTNDPAFVESLKVNPVREGKSTATTVDALLRGEAFNLPAGKVGWALGSSWWREKLVDTPDELSQQGLVVGSIQQSAVDASRNAWAAYGELMIPVLKNVELQAALRYDHYPTDSAWSPKVGARWLVTPNFALRGSYTESFRMPSLKQLYGAQEQGAGTLDPAACEAFGLPEDCATPFFEVQGSNPDLKAEKGKTYNIGGILDAGPFSASIDWWRIDKKDAIGQPTIVSAINQGLYGRDPETGQLLIYTNLQNVAEARNEGIDTNLRLVFPNTLLGTITLANGNTYYLKQRNREAGGDEWAEFNGTYALPRWRNVFQAGFDTKAWSVTAFVRSVGGFSDTDTGWTESEPIPEDTRKVSSHTEVDLNVGWTGIKGLRIDAGIKNLFDEEPPFSLTNSINNQYTQMGFAELYTSRGRFFYIGAQYQFK
jgi:iron complex outermembrane receptor protein